MSVSDFPSARFVRAFPPAQPPPGPAFWLPFRAGSLLVRQQGDGVRLFRDDQAGVARPPLRDPLYLGDRAGVPCLAGDIDPEEPVPPGWQVLDLRTLFGRLDDEDCGLAGYASQLLYWRRTSGFCPVCGQATEANSGDWGRRCPHCGHVGYPRVSPAVLALVHDGRRLLLAQKSGWGTVYSILAGFVEPGETLEECVRREVLEEVGIQVTDLVYVGSQSWPYPHQLMVGFFARYAGGTVRHDEAELAEASWFSVEALPALPSPVSLSRQMIDAWIAACADQESQGI